MFFTEFAHSVAEEGSWVWELPAVTSITQLCGDSSSSWGSEPSSSSSARPPPKLTAALRRFSCKTTCTSRNYAVEEGRSVFRWSAGGIKGWSIIQYFSEGMFHRISNERLLAVNQNLQITHSFFSKPHLQIPTCEGEIALHYTRDKWVGKGQ